MCETPEEHKDKEDNKVALKALAHIVEKMLDAGSDHVTTFEVWEGANEVEFEFHKCCGLNDYEQMEFMHKIRKDFDGEDVPEGKLGYEFEVAVCHEHTEIKKYVEEGNQYDESVPCLLVTMRVTFSPEDWVKKYGRKLHSFDFRRNTETGDLISKPETEISPEEKRAEKDLFHA